MVTLAFAEHRITLAEGETVLDALLRGGVEVAHTCRTGVCRSCLIRAKAGPIPAAAQAGLRAVERERGLFMACVCRPDHDLELAALDDADSVLAEVVEVARLTATVVRLRLAPQTPLAYTPGQYLSVARADGLARSYSLASVPSEPWLELHVRRLDDGRLSRWAYDEVGVGDTVSVRGPYGSCCYVRDQQPDAPLLLVAVGTGLAPLWGVARDALAAGHRGPITLITAAAEPSGLYLREPVRELARAHPQVTVRECVLRDGAGEIEEAAVDELAVASLRTHATPAEHLAFVCGDPAVVQRIRRGLFMAGLSARRIFADAFVTAAPAVR